MLSVCFKQIRVSNHLLKIIRLTSTFDGLRAGGPGSDSGKRQEIFLYSTASRSDEGPKQPPTQRVAKALSPRLKLPVREAYHSHPTSSAEVKSGGAKLSFSHTSSWRGV
jgi:hypothetical protein